MAYLKAPAWRVDGSGAVWSRPQSRFLQLCLQSSPGWLIRYHCYLYVYAYIMLWCYVMRAGRFLAEERREQSYPPW